MAGRGGVKIWRFLWGGVKNTDCFVGGATRNDRFFSRLRIKGGKGVLDTGFRRYDRKGQWGGGIVIYPALASPDKECYKIRGQR